MTAADPLPDGIVLVVSVIVNRLDIEEVIALRLCELLGSDPRPVRGYDKARSLYTESDGTRMHQANREAFLNLTGRRIARDREAS